MKIYYTSDTHGHYFPTDYTDSEVKPIGVLSMSKNWIKDENTLIMDGGDTLQGSPFAFFRQLNNDSKTAGILASKAGYDFITLGNHDFNYGYDYLRDFVNNFTGKVICSNLEDLRGELKNLYKYYITEIEGKKIGIIGAVTDWVNVWEQDKNKEGYIVHKTLPSVIEAYEYIKDCDYKICIYHGGMEFDICTKEIIEFSEENVSGKMAENMDLDLLLTGHQHRLIPFTEYSNTKMVQPGSHSSTYLELNIDIDSKKLTSEVMYPTGEYDKNLFNDELLLENKTQVFLDNKITTLEEDLFAEDRLKMALNGSKLADFINEIQIKVSNANISITSFANEISGLSKNVTIREILNTCKFANTLKVLEIDGKSLREAISHNYKFIDNIDGEYVINDSFINPKLQLYNFDFFYGIDFDVNLNSENKEVTRLEFNGKEVKDSDKFDIVMNSYRATGVAGFTMYSDLEVKREISKDTTDIIIEYLSNNK